LLTLALGIDPVVERADIVDRGDFPQVIGMVGTEGRPVLSEGDDTWLGEAILLQIVRHSDHPEDLQILEIGEEGENGGAIGLSLEGMRQTPAAIGLAHHRGRFPSHSKTHLVHLVGIKASEGLALRLWALAAAPLGDTNVAQEHDDDGQQDPVGAQLHRRRLQPHTPKPMTQTTRG